MTRPVIVQDEGQIGFHWSTPTGVPVRLDALVKTDDEPRRLLPTHLEALDDALIIAAGRFGEILGGGRGPADDAERTGLRELHRAMDRLSWEYHAAVESMGAVISTRAGQILGTAFLMSVMARRPLSLLGPAPFEGELDEPGIGVVAGYGDLVWVDGDRPWRGARWVVRTEDGRRLPATLSMLLFDSSGVQKDAARDEHRAAIGEVLAALPTDDLDAMTAASALDWMLYDWLMAHRDGPDSAAVDVKDRPDDAVMIVRAAAASTELRARFDPELLRIPARCPA
ncbi:hypothetical protein GCM10009547_16130 [Sporichthya brevicatena]|uniref:Uncharacterized protein n=1 Tax=Sporichthya brevicatena TaxID=171442 RepID=A0ABP3RQ97_9ACTN